MSIRDIQLLLVGDLGVGKTSLLCFWFNRLHRPLYRIFGRPDYVSQMKVDGVAVAIECLEMPSDRNFYHPECFVYQTHPTKDVAIICFSLMCQRSFENVNSKWYPDIKRHYGEVPIILVGTKLDLREVEDGDLWSTYGKPPIERSQGEALAVSMNAIKYFELSFRNTATQVKVLEEAVRVVLRMDLEKQEEDKKREEGKTKEKKKSKRMCGII